MDEKIVYTCKDCGACGVRLWREYNTFLDNITLRCRACAMLNQPGKASADSDAIGWLIPAVPTVEMDTFWGYTSVPQDRCAWWDALPVEEAAEVTQLRADLARLAAERASALARAEKAEAALADPVRWRSALEDIARLTAEKGSLMADLFEARRERDAARQAHEMTQRVWEKVAAERDAAIALAESRPAITRETSALWRNLRVSDLCTGRIGDETRDLVRALRTHAEKAVP
jgi:hypothetical protein